MVSHDASRAGSEPFVEPALLHRGFRYRLAPTPEQEAKLGQFAGVTRLIYNLALQQRRDFWRQHHRQTGEHLNFVTQGREVTALRSAFDWIAAVPTGPMIQALRDLDRSFLAFYRGNGFPTPRKRGRDDSFRFRAVEVPFRRLNSRWSEVRIPKIGWVKFRYTRALEGRVRNVTFSRDALGWHVSFASEIARAILPSSLPVVGIDRGVTNTVALSTGELISVPTNNLMAAKKRAQRVLARRVRGSGRYRRQRRRVAALAAKIARVRADWRHRTTYAIATRFGLAALENLNTKGMTRAGVGKHGLNRSILEQGWHAFEVVLTYKLEQRGGRLVKVNPAYTSQTCSACGTIDKASRESQASYVCRACGFAAHADTNAAINILRRSTASKRVEVGGCPAVEARTVVHAGSA